MNPAGARPRPSGHAPALAAFPVTTAFAVETNVSNLTLLETVNPVIRNLAVAARNPATSGDAVTIDASTK
jgi:hypothetical protein